MTLFKKKFKTKPENKIPTAQGISSKIMWWIVFILIALWTVTLLYALFWILTSSFKDQYDYSVNKFLPPSFEFLTLDNYSKCFNEFYVTVYDVINGVTVPRNAYFLELMFNSFYFTITQAFLSIFVPAIVAYVVCKYDFWFNKVLSAIVVFSMVVPIGGSLGSSLQVMKATGVYDSLIGALIMRYAFVGINFLYMEGAFKGVSSDYMESAFMDGAGHFRVLFQIMFPLIKNVFLMFFLQQIIAWWNTWDFTYIYMPHHPNLAQAVYYVTTSLDNTLAIKPVKLAVCTITLLPSMIFFFIFKNQIMTGVDFGGLKG